MSTQSSPSRRLPVLFVSHGSPMLAVEPGEAGLALQQFGRQLRAGAVPLRGVVLMSAHWMAPQPTVMTHPAPATWHDFGGFPSALYRLQYPAPGSPALAQQVLDLLTQAGLPAAADAKRPFDHGAWVPLLHLLPQADVPVVQLALPAGAGPAEVYALGQALRPLREQGVLLIGSGSMTHNLHDVFAGEVVIDAPAMPYVEAFSRWMSEHIEAQDLPALLRYRELAPHAVRAHPSDEHFLPLFFALGAAGLGTIEAPRVDYLTHEVQYGALAMDSLALQ
ncbi:MAG TPA: class III extradiol ring-cleavage dioxygenase [Macromonas sp.]|nr:class III extradiol ring-cleavage dioxygenase [Macromonas sp.]